MESRVLCAGLAALLTFSAAAAAHDPTQPTEPAATHADPATAAAIAVVDQFSAALKGGNLEGAGKFLAEDVLILESGGAERTRQEYLGGHAGHDAAFLKNARITIKHRTARVDGDHAWVGTEIELATNNKKSAPKRLSSTETMVLKRSAGGWQIVHIHWSSGAKR